MTYEVVFSLSAAAELVRIAGAVQPAAAVIQAAENIRRTLERAPQQSGQFLSEGLYSIDDEPLRAFYMVDDESMVVEITDFRIL